MTTLPEWLQFLMLPGRLPASEAGVELIETHISWVLLTATEAWKFKKPLNLGFLDFSTLAQRQEACDTELRLNRRTAPELYLEVVPLAGAPDAPLPWASGPVREYAVRMRRFAAEALLSARLKTGQLDAPVLEALARHVAGFHQAAAVAQPDGAYGTPQQVHTPVRQNFAQLRPLIDAAAQLDALQAWAEARFAELAGLMQARLMAGRVRECHGDMHLGNLVLLQGEPRLFDAIEFNPQLRWTDVIADVAFLVMDLQACRQPGLAWSFLNAWLEASGDYAGLALLPYYLCYRAMVRAKVAGIRSAQAEGEARAAALAECRLYLNLATTYTCAAAPCLLITHGLSGSGKSRHSRELLARLGLIRLRADVERKRLAGLGSLDRSGSRLAADLYSPAMTARTYQHLAERTAELTQAGFSVLVDATFLEQERRQFFADLAARLELPFAILSFTAPAAVLRQRVTARARHGRDASEAGLEVLTRQLATQEVLTASEMPHVLSLDTAQQIDWDQALFQLQGLLQQPG